MTPREGAIITAYTGILCGSMKALHEYSEKILGRGIMTHEMGTKDVWAELKGLSRPDFIEICKGIRDQESDK